MTHIFARGCGFLYSRLRSSQTSLPVFHENEAIHGLTPLCGAKVFVEALLYLCLEILIVLYQDSPTSHRPS